MSPLQHAALSAAALGAGVWCLARSLRRAPVSLVAARRQMLGSVDGPAIQRRSISTGLADGGIGRIIDRRFGAGLVVLHLTVADVVTRVMVSATIVAGAVLATVTLLLAMGMLPASPIWLLLVVVSGALAGFTALHDVSTRIDRARRSLRRAANDFVQLVAVGLTTDQSVDEAVRFALGVGVGESFDVLRDAIHTAPQRGVPLWEAIDEVARRYEVRELAELATSIERQGLQGVSIGQTVAALAVAMRAKGLDELERDADRANANLSGPTIGFVVSTIVFLAYPLAQRISEAFGG